MFVSDYFFRHEEVFLGEKGVDSFAPFQQIFLHSDKSKEERRVGLEVEGSECRVAGEVESLKSFRFIIIIPHFKTNNWPNRRHYKISYIDS